MGACRSNKKRKEKDSFRILSLKYKGKLNPSGKYSDLIWNVVARGSYTGKVYFFDIIMGSEGTTTKLLRKIRLCSNVHEVRRLGKNTCSYEVLRDDGKGNHSIEWNLYDPGLRRLCKRQLKAYHITSSDWEFMKYVVSKEHDPADYEENEYVFTIITDNDVLNTLSWPWCDTPEEMAPRESTIGNCIECSADVMGTISGAKAEMMFVFYLTDLSKYAVVTRSYWDC